jgi:hypothetical protein
VGSSRAQRSIPFETGGPLQAAEVWTPQDTARHLETTLRTITVALHRMRDRYNFPTNEALIAVAVKLEWIPLAIDTTDDPKRRRRPGRRGF